MLDDADVIWNRACDPFAQLSGTGDRALQAVLLVHGMVMNGGVEHAVESLSADELRAGTSGFEYLGLGDVGDVLREAIETAFPAGPIADRDERQQHMVALRDETYERLDELDRAYSVLVPQDDVLEKAFRRRLRTLPRDFAAL